MTSHVWIGVRALRQMDNHTFAIDWTDGTTSKYRLSDLQKRCPCANCVDEATGQRRTTQLTSDNIKAVAIRNVGRYALQIQFSQGCSTGIYSFEMLKQLDASPTGES